MLFLYSISYVKFTAVFGGANSGNFVVNVAKLGSFGNLRPKPNVELL